MALQFARLEQIQEMAEKLIGRISSLATRVNTLEQAGGQPNLIERIFVNGFVVNPDENKDVKLTVPTKVNELENDAGFQENVIEKIKRNGMLLGIEDGKTVDISVPVNLSDLINDADFQNGDEVKAAIQTAISKSGHASFQKVDAIPTAEEAQDNILYLVMNEVTSHYDIYAKIGETMELLDDTTVDLSNYVMKNTLNGYVAKVEGKDLSANDFTTELLNKLNGIEENANNYTLDKQKVIAALGYTPGNAEEMTVTWDNVQNKPESYTPSAHSHTKSDITDFPTSLPANGGTADDSTKWGGKTLRLDHNVSDTWIPVFSDANVDYILKNEIVPDKAVCAAKLGRNANADVPMSFWWNGQGGQPTWLWGGENGSDMYVYNPSNFNVNYANGSGNVQGFWITAQTGDPGAWSNLDTNRVLLVYE